MHHAFVKCNYSPYSVIWDKALTLTLSLTLSLTLGLNLGLAGLGLG